MALNVLRHSRFLLGILALALVLGLVACSSPKSVMALVFDIPPPGKAPPTAPEPRLARRTVPDNGPGLVLSKEYIALQEALLKAGKPPNWPEVYKKLPKDDEDNINWAEALEAKLINPAAGIDDTTPQPKVMDEDIELATSGKPNRMVVFSHKVHTTWLRCANCHNAIFEKEAGNAKITMAAIDDGKYCGVCHDKVALAPQGCKGCHKPIKKV